MTDTIVGVIATLLEKLRALVDFERERERRFMSDHVDPIYADMQTVYDDYRRIVTDAIRALDDPTICIDVGLRSLRDRGDVLRPLRQDLLAYSRLLLASNNSESTLKFARACHRLLDWQPTSGSIPGLRSLCTGLLGLIVYVLSLGSGAPVDPASTEEVTQWMDANPESLRHADRKLIRMLMIDHLQRLDGRWREVRASYQDMRVRYLT